MKRSLLLVMLLLGTCVALADEAPQGEPDPNATEEQASPPGEAKEISGMSILGNQEAPKSLVIVPWKTSEIGASLVLSTVLDDSRQPVDREVFMRALIYYEISSKMTP